VSGTGDSDTAGYRSCHEIAMSPRVLVCPALVAALFLSACATDPVTAHSGAAGGKGTGTVVVQLDRAIPGLGVIVDDETVVEGAHTDQITVDGVEPGGRRIRVVASSITLEEDLAYDRVHKVAADGASVIEIEAPAESVIFKDTVLLLMAIAITLG
jgi:hypothetical protein